MKYRFLEHTADIKFQAFGGTLEKTFENAALALKETMTKGLKGKIKSRTKKKIRVQGKDKEALLYNFLEEFLFLLDSEDFLLSFIENIKISRQNKEYELNCECAGDSAANYKFTNEVKAITYNEMFVKQKDKKFICQGVLDV